MKFVYLVLLVAYLCITPRSALAVGEFSADYDVQYAIAPSGITIVTQNVTLTNQLTNLYPQKYAITIDSLKIRNIIAYDNLGIIRPEIKQIDGKTEITLTFNEKVAGLGKRLPFSLRYESTDIAVKNGSIWEINIPGVAPDPDLDSYVVTLRVPEFFGTNAYMSPLPALGSKWTKEQMTRGGISAAYGNEQSFDVTLSYYLANPTVQNKKSELALPPDTAFQKVSLTSLTPAPDTVTQDVDGNWKAQYTLLPTQKLEVKADLAISIFLKPRTGYHDTLSDRSIYTKPDTYWEVNDQRVQALSSRYTTPRQVYDYVVQTLNYDYQRISQMPVRKGAVAALENPNNSICMEFTDLFIAIARAAGIPAREAVGYAHTTNVRLRPLSFVTDVLHAWPEYFDDARQIWVPVDPTWADTTGGVNYFDKLDFNHIVFAYHGQESQYPYPAGFYKKPGENTKDVIVNFSQEIHSIVQSNATISYDFPKKATSGFIVRGQVIVQNNGQSALYDTPLHIQSVPTDVAISQIFTSIPPYAKIAIPVAVSLPGYFYQGSGSLTTTIGDTVAKLDFVIVPLVYQFLLPITAACAIVIILTFAWIRSKKH